MILDEELWDMRSYFKYSDNGIQYTRCPLLDDLDQIPKSKYIDASDYKNRLDKISYKLYGTYHLYWVLMYYNNIINIYDFKNTHIYYIDESKLIELLLKNKIVKD